MSRRWLLARHRARGDFIHQCLVRSDTKKLACLVPTGMEVALPGAVDGGSDSEEESSSAAGSQQIEEPLRGKQMFFRQSSGIEEKAQTVEDMNVAQLRNIIKDEVVEKVRELGIVGRGHGNIGHTDRSEDIIHIDPHKTASRDHLPRNLAQAVPVAIPWFFGGFSRQSPIRMKCLQVSLRAVCAEDAEDSPQHA